MLRSRRFYSVVSMVGCLCMIFSILMLFNGISFAGSHEKLMTEGKININTADQEELIQLKRIGPSLAERIIAYREEHGPFMKPEDILNVRGIGPKFWEANKDMITTGEKEAKVK